MDIVLELILVGLLTATLLHAVRLQRALGSLRGDRAALQDAVAGFESGTRQAEAGLARLREAAEQLGAQLQQAGALRDDLGYLSERGEAAADRLDTLVRAARTVEPSEAALPARAAHAAPELADAPRLRSQAERSLLVALQARR